MPAPIWAETPRALAEQCDVVFTSLPEPPEVEAVALGTGRPARRHAAGRGLVRSLDQLAERRAELHAAFAEKGAHMLDAPVSGGPAGASPASSRSGSAARRRFRQAQGGARRDRRPGRYIGPIGAATVAKLVHNMAGYAINGALAEIFTMGVKAGVEPLALWKAVRQGAAGRR